MKLLFDLFPVILFFVAFKFAGIYPDASLALAQTWLGPLMFDGTVPAGQGPILLATAVAIVASLLQVGWLLARRKTVDPMLWISVAVIIVFGGATIWLHDETFIKWKPTVLYWAFGGTLLVSAIVFKRNLIQSMTQGQIELPAHLWGRLNLSWVGFFVFMGVLNLYVAFNFSESAWVKFKMFGGMGLMVVFALAQGVVLSRYIDQEEKK